MENINDLRLHLEHWVNNTSWEDLANVLLNRLQKSIIPETQCGFRLGKALWFFLPAKCVRNVGNNAMYEVT